jgi:hypothetical protein
MNTTTLNMTTLDGGVIIKKGTAPAPPSGGEKWVYTQLNTPTLASNLNHSPAMSFLFSLVKIHSTNSGDLMVSGLTDFPAWETIAIATNLSVKVSATAPFGEGIMSVEDILHNMASMGGVEGSAADVIASLIDGVTITKEEFYNLD